MPYNKNGEFYVEGLTWTEEEKERLEKCFHHFRYEIESSIRKKRGLEVFEEEKSENVSLQNEESNLQKKNKHLQEEFEKKIFQSPEEELENRTVYRSICEENNDANGENLVEDMDAFYREVLKNRIKDFEESTGIREVAKNFGKYNRTYERDYFLNIVEKYNNGGGFNSAGVLEEKIKFGELTADKVYQLIYEGLSPSFPNEQDRIKNKNNFILCVGMNRTLNPTGDYRLAKKPVFSWSRVRTNAAFAFRAFYDLGLWIGFAIPEGYYVLDIDQPEDVEAFRSEIRQTSLQNGWNIFQTVNGFHVWAQEGRETEGLKNTHYVLRNGFRATVRKHGGYVVLMSHWNNRLFKVGLGEECSPTSVCNLTPHMAYFSSRYWISRGNGTGWELNPYFLATEKYSCEKTPTPLPLLSESEQKQLDLHSDNTDFSDDPVSAKKIQQNTEQDETVKLLTKSLSKIRVPVGGEARDHKKLKTFRDEVIQKGIEKLFDALPEDVTQLITSTAPPKGRYDRDTHAIVKAIRKKCKTKGVRHLTFLHSGNRAGMSKLSAEELKYILKNIFFHTENFKRSCFVFLRGYYHGATKMASTHQEKINSRPLGITRQEGEFIFQQKQIAKFAQYVLSLPKLPKYFTAQELEQIGIKGNAKGLGPSVRIYENGKQKRVRFLNPVGIRKLKIKRVNFTLQEHIEKFAHPYFLFKNAPKIHKDKQKTNKTTPFIHAHDYIFTPNFCINNSKNSCSKWKNGDFD